METIWAKSFGFVNTHTIWKNIYDQKLIKIPIPKLAEFNFKLLHNIIPCGKILNKWNKKVSEKCNKCNEIETTEHMIFLCSNVRYVWGCVSNILKVNVKWKTIICGFVSSEYNENVKLSNIVISIVAYSIFKFNNTEKWNETKNNFSIEQFVTKNVLFFKLFFKVKNIKILEDRRIEHLIELLL